MTQFTLHIRRGVVVNTDPMRRCYNGCHYSSRTDWGPWELWMRDYTFPTREAAEYTAGLFKREDLEFKAVEVTND